ncbi:MAG: outer membrane protein assembly factor BamD [Spartobacteria bacterium]|nr:outer membrane protein assembly factor BamD [Spartobacteria bacterium]
MQILHTCKKIGLLGLLIGALGPAVSLQAADKAYNESMDRYSNAFFRKTKKTTPAGQFEYALSLEAREKYKAAGKQYYALVRRWPDAPEAPTAQYNYARMLDKHGKRLQAFDEYQRLMEQYAGFFPYEEVLEKQFDIAKWLKKRKKGKLLLFPGFSAPERAIPLLEKVTANGPAWEHAPEAQYLIGQIYDETMQLELATVAYATLQYRYPDSPYAEKATYNKAYDLYRLATESQNDQDLAVSAYAALTFFINTYPRSDYLPQARSYRDILHQRQAEAAYKKARFYDKVARKPKAAIVAYKRFIQQYPDSGWTPTAETRIQELNNLLEQKK